MDSVEKIVNEIYLKQMQNFEERGFENRNTVVITKTKIKNILCEAINNARNDILSLIDNIKIEVIDTDDSDGNIYYCKGWVNKELFALLCEKMIDRWTITSADIHHQYMRYRPKRHNFDEFLDIVDEKSLHGRSNGAFKVTTYHAY